RCSAGKRPVPSFLPTLPQGRSLNVDPRVAQISALLHQVAETHHAVFAITDGTDADWATWYADWLANLSSIGELLGGRPVRSELTYVLVGLDKEYTLQNPRP